MGASQEKMHCTRYLNGQGPPSLEQQFQAQTQGQIKQGNQPKGGELNFDILRQSLPGHPDHDTLRIVFHFDDGIQSDAHPHPGHTYKGGDYVVFFPHDSTGSKCMRLLDLAFKNQLLFTVAADSSGEYVVTPADIPLNTLDSVGKPNPEYFKTLRKTMKQKGIQ